MAITRQQNWLGQQRVDAPHLRALESSVAADFDVVAGRVMGGDEASVVAGFYIDNFADSPKDATTLRVVVAGGVVIHPLASESGSVLKVPTDRDPEVLSGTNDMVVGGWTPDAINYIGVDLVRTADDTTSDLVAFLDANTNTEDTRTVPLARTLDYRITISTVDFVATSNVCPIAKVAVNTSGQATAVTDCRNMMYRLSAGGSVPDHANTYPWPGGRLNRTGNYYNDGDKAIGSQKDWQLAIMSRLWELGGGESWYDDTADRNVRLCGSQSALFGTSNDNFYWDGADLVWQGLQFAFSNTAGWHNEIADQATASPGLTDLADGECLYVDIDRSQNLTGGNALVAAKTPMTSLGSPAIPGSRFIIAWRIGSELYFREHGYLGTGATGVIYAETISVLRGIDGGLAAVVGGYTTAGDGGGGIFRWDASESSAENYGTIILPTGHVGNGRWMRMYEADHFNVKWFGATGDGTTDDTVAIQRAITASDTKFGVVSVYYPRGNYKISATLDCTVATEVRFLGERGPANITAAAAAHYRSRILTSTMPPSTAGIIELQGSVNVVLENMDFVGGNSDNVEQFIEYTGVNTGVALWKSVGVTWTGYQHPTNDGWIYFPASSSLNRVQFDDCRFNTTDTTAVLIELSDSAPTSALQHLIFKDVIFESCWGGVFTRVSPLYTHAYDLIASIENSSFNSCKYAMGFFDTQLCVRNTKFYYGLNACEANGGQTPHVIGLGYTLPYMPDISEPITLIYGDAQFENCSFNTLRFPGSPTSDLAWFRGIGIENTDYQGGQLSLVKCRQTVGSEPAPYEAFLFAEDYSGMNPPEKGYFQYNVDDAVTVPEAATPAAYQKGACIKYDDARKLTRGNIMLRVEVAANEYYHLVEVRDTRFVYGRGSESTYSTPSSFGIPVNGTNLNGDLWVARTPVNAYHQSYIHYGGTHYGCAMVTPYVRCSTTASVGTPATYAQEVMTIDEGTLIVSGTQGSYVGTNVFLPDIKNYGGRDLYATVKDGGRYASVRNIHVYPAQSSLTSMEFPGATSAFVLTNDGQSATFIYDVVTDTWRAV